jgi:hypothetical protein
MVGWIVNVLIVLLSLAAAGLLTVYVVGRLAVKTVKTVRRMPVVRKIPVIGVRPPEPPQALDHDLRAYPDRLLALEARLVDRHGAVQEQLRLLGERRAEVASKEDRADLVARYEEDIGHLDRRATSMRRVLALVWRTRAILALRVFYAVTGRLRPKLGTLPDGSRNMSREELVRARSAYLDAASSVRFYVDEVRERLRVLDEVVPVAPVSAEADASMREAVAAERGKVRGAHEALIARMDRLADNLTWLGDHAGTLHVVDDEVALPAAGPHGESASHLLEEVDAAVTALNALAGAVDRHLADRALDELTDDVSRLELKGLEEQAAAEAEIEVARIVEGFSS